MSTSTIAEIDAAITRRSEFWDGVRATFPLVVGAIPFGIIFGALAVNSGLSVGATAAMSAFVFAGSAQFVATGLVAGGAGILVIILTTFVVNLRHSLYSATLAPHVKHLPQRWLVPLGFWLTDETFLVVAERFRRTDQSPVQALVLPGVGDLHVYQLAALHLDRHFRRSIHPRSGQLGPGLCFGRNLCRHAGACTAFPTDRHLCSNRWRGRADLCRTAQSARPDRCGIGWRRRRRACRTVAKTTTPMTAQEALLIAGMALVTFAVRWPVLAVVSRVSLPEPILEGMKFIPPAVLTAIIVPAMLMPTGALDLSYTNAYLVAGIASGMIAWRWRNLLLTIVLGMAFFLAWQWFT